ncbi:MAG: PEP-CTERM sorting domain-containing protein [Phycisphaerae bacterium]|nr:PEP-CTERM sorting domain-containing protein [Phycisphaerae bacterium]
MKKRIAALVSVVLVAALAGNSYGLVIGNFEGGLDGWLANDAALSVSSTGATTGSGAMLLEMGVGGWHINGRYDAKPIRDVLGMTTEISMDITAFAQDMTATWMNVEVVINGMNSDDTGPHNNIGWRPLGGKDLVLDGVAHSYTWTVPTALMTQLAGVDGNIWWLEVMLVSNNDSSNTKFYVDNVQLIPEPATLGLLGLGGLALLRHRK